jgi:E3 ubiquitin-protein ligase RNF115/126
MPQSPRGQDPRYPAGFPGPGFDAQNDIMSQFFGGSQTAARFPGPNMTGRSPMPQSPGEGLDPNPLLVMMRTLLSGHPMMMNGAGDAAYSQEEFDRIMSQLMEQSQQGGGEPPASQDEIRRIPKITVDQEWLDAQENKDCSICMEEAKLGDEISELWCGHWYHPFCIKQWVEAHGACPLCRKSLREAREEWEAKNPSKPEKKRRRSSRPHDASRRHSSYDHRGQREEDGGSTSRSVGGEEGGSGITGRIRDGISRWMGGGSTGR